MKRKPLPLILVLMLLLGLFTHGCNFLKTSASEVAKEYWLAIASKEYDIAYDYLSVQAKKNIAGSIARSVSAMGTAATTEQAVDALEANDDNIRQNYFEGFRYATMQINELKESDMGNIEVLSSTRNGDVTEVILGIGKAQITVKVIQEKGDWKILIEAPKPKTSSRDTKK